jgi:CRP/FNR family transcriptional regulator
VLLKLGQKVGRTETEGVRIGIVLTRQDIADMVGSTVETTIRILSRLTKKELIETRGKSILLKDVAALEAIVELEGKL